MNYNEIFIILWQIYACTCCVLMVPLAVIDKPISVLHNHLCDVPHKNKILKILDKILWRAHKLIFKIVWNFMSLPFNGKENLYEVLNTFCDDRETLDEVDFMLDEINE